MMMNHLTSILVACSESMEEQEYEEEGHVTNFLTKSCMFAYEWQYRTMHVYMYHSNSQRTD